MHKIVQWLLWLTALASLSSCEIDSTPMTKVKVKTQEGVSLVLDCKTWHWYEEWDTVNVMHYDIFKDMNRNQEFDTWDMLQRTATQINGWWRIGSPQYVGISNQRNIYKDLVSTTKAVIQEVDVVEKESK